MFAKKRKLSEEDRTFNAKWELDYFISNNNNKIQCLICMKVLSVSKEYYVKRHYTSLHEENIYTDTPEKDKLLQKENKKRNIPQHQKKCSRKIKAKKIKANNIITAKLIESSTSESETFSLQDSDASFGSFGDVDDPDLGSEPLSLLDDYCIKEGDYALIKCILCRKNCQSCKFQRL